MSSTCFTRCATTTADDLIAAGRDGLRRIRNAFWSPARGASAVARASRGGRQRAGARRANRRPTPPPSIGCLTQWLPRHFTRCTNGSCDEGPLRGNRCDAQYWRGHCRDVAGMMQAIAHLVGGNDFLARSLGASKKSRQTQEMPTNREFAMHRDWRNWKPLSL